MAKKLQPRKPQSRIKSTRLGSSGVQPWSWRWMAVKAGNIDIGYFTKAVLGTVSCSDEQLTNWATLLGLPSGIALRTFALRKQAADAVKRNRNLTTAKTAR
jgi:hypothetical protein